MPLRPKDSPLMISTPPCQMHQYAGAGCTLGGGDEIRKGPCRYMVYTYRPRELAMYLLRGPHKYHITLSRVYHVATWTLWDWSGNISGFGPDAQSIGLGFRGLRLPICAAELMGMVPTRECMRDCTKL